MKGRKQKNNNKIYCQSESKYRREPTHDGSQLLCFGCNFVRRRRRRREMRIIIKKCIFHPVYSTKSKCIFHGFFLHTTNPLMLWLVNHYNYGSCEKEHIIRYSIFDPNQAYKQPTNIHQPYCLSVFHPRYCS